MALSIRRGASRVFVITLEGCEDDDFIWSDLGRLMVRLAQGANVVDKLLTIDAHDRTKGYVYFSQGDTIKFKDNAKAKLQIFTLKDSTYHQLAIKTDTFEVNVLESLWNEVVDKSHAYVEEYLPPDSPEFTEPVGHDYYQYLHIDISEFAGIITSVPGTILSGTNLVYNGTSETLYSTT